MKSFICYTLYYSILDIVFGRFYADIVKGGCVDILRFLLSQVSISTSQNKQLFDIPAVCKYDCAIIFCRDCQ